MKKSKLLALLLTVTMLASVFGAAGVPVSAEVATVTPAAPEGHPDNPPRLMYPGYVHWMNFANMSAVWGFALNMTEHVWSDFADQGDMASRTYVELDKEMQASSTAGNKGDYYQGVFKADDPTYYRDLLWYGTFQGTRIDHASFGKNADNYLDYYVYPDSYVAASLVISTYWMFNIGNSTDARYQDLHEQYIIQTSADRSDWVTVDTENVNYYWEHGTEDNSIPVNSYASVIASIKMPAGHMYYRIKSPWFDGMDWMAAAVGPVKVSTASTFDGATGDTNAATYYAPSSKDQRLLDFDPVNGNARVKSVDPVTVDTLAFWIDLNSANGSFKFFTSDDQEITDTATVLDDGMKIYVYSSSGEYMMNFVIAYEAPENVTIDFNNPRKALNPGVADNVKLHPIADQKNRDWLNYSDYAFGFEAATVSSQVHLDNKHYGTHFGVLNYGAYRVWTPGEYLGVKYRVVPGSYVSTSLLLHASLVADNGVVGSESMVKEAAKRFRIFTSPDGVNWTQAVLEDADLFIEHGVPGTKTSFDGSNVTSLSGFAAVRSNVQIPDGHRYYLVEQPTYYAGDYCYIGGSKASLTTMEGEATGDETIAWYALPEVVSNYFDAVLLNEETGIMTVKAEGSITLQTVYDYLLITDAYVEFFTSEDVKITDLSTEVESGMYMKYSSDEELLETFEIDAQIVLPPEEPGIESSDDTIVVVDDENGKLTVKTEGLTYQQLLDLLILKGDVLVVFTDELGNEIDDLSQVLEEGTFASLYTSVFLGEYEIAFDFAADEDEDEDDGNPQTADSSALPSAIIVILAGAAFAITVSRRRRATIR